MKYSEQRIEETKELKILNLMEAQKLDPEFKAKWIAALRSGEYKQGSGQLYDSGEDCYCCLGVACRVAGVDDIPAEIEFIGDTYHDHKYYDSKRFLPRSVPTLLAGCNNVTQTLADMNDGVYQKTPAKSFSQIADWIEANL